MAKPDNLRSIRARFPLEFFSSKLLLPANIEVLAGNALALRAMAPGENGIILRSKEYILFGSGLGTLLFEPSKEGGVATTYTMNFNERRNAAGNRFWFVESLGGLEDCSIPWTLRIFIEEPDDDCGHVIPLAYMRSQLPWYSGQFICLYSPAV